MGSHQHTSRYQRRKERDRRRAWRVWDQGNCRFGALVDAVRRTAADTYRLATGHEYDGPQPFDGLLLLLRKEELLARTKRDE